MRATTRRPISAARPGSVAVCRPTAHVRPRTSPVPSQPEPSNPRSDDIGLVRRTLAGDEDAIRSFIERLRFVPRVLAVRNVRWGRPFSQDELDDLAQETLTDVWRRLANYDGRAPLEAWVRRFALNEFMAALKRRRNLPVALVAADEVPGDAGGVEEPSGSEARGVLEALARLEPDLARIVHLKHFESLSFRQIAVLLELSPNTAKSRYYRGLRALRQNLGSNTGRRDVGGLRA